MHLALSPQHGSWVCVLWTTAARIFLVELEESLSELDVVLAVERGKRPRQHRRRGAMLTSEGGAIRAVVNVSPVLTASSLPNATTSPAHADARLVSCAPVAARMPEIFPASPDDACTVAASSKRPVSTRASDSLPPCWRCMVLNT